MEPLSELLRVPQGAQSEWRQPDPTQEGHALKQPNFLDKKNFLPQAYQAIRKYAYFYNRKTVA